MATICVYCGSSPGDDPAFGEAARSLGRYLGAQGHELVYGGGKVGLMGILADAVLEHGGEVTGIMPEHLVAKEVAHHGLTRLLTVSSMHERKAAMIARSDGFLALPGGTGTLEEIVEAFVWMQLGLHRKACGLLNISGFYDPLLDFLHGMSASRFLREDQRSQLLVGNQPEELVERVLNAEVALIDKWMDREDRRNEHFPMPGLD